MYVPVGGVVTVEREGASGTTRCGAAGHVLGDAKAGELADVAGGAAASHRPTATVLLE